ncbi:MAG: hypothetical protein E6J13_07420 [Chloroflexi bacterium]|nr:MAG: hypothetical protein E6J13_07420 [Chloroflexota bacterium]
MNRKLFVPDRPTLALAAAVGVAYLFLGASLPLAILTAILVCVARGLLEAALSYRRTPRPRAGTPEAMWVARAEAAAASIRRLRASAGSGAVAHRSTVVARQAADAVVILRRLAYQSDVVARFTGRTDLAELHRTNASLRQQHDVLTEGPARRHNEQTLRSLAATLEAGEHLESTHRELLGRIETATLGLEGLVARVAEVVALSEFSSPLAVPRVDELAAELDTLRAALVETEDLSRSALASPNQEGG